VKKLVWTSESLLNPNPIKRSTRYQKLLKKEQDISLAPSRQQNIEKIIEIFKIIAY